MTRKHYELIAAIIRSQSTIQDIAEELAFRFKEENTRFDIDKFLEACGF